MLTVLMTTTQIPRQELERMNRHRNRTKRGRSPTLVRKQPSLREESLREGPAEEAHGGRDGNEHVQRGRNEHSHGAVDMAPRDELQRWPGIAEVIAAGSDGIYDDNEKRVVGSEGKPGKEI
jgi:hypothetical protein